MSRSRLGTDKEITIALSNLSALCGPSYDFERIIW
jgi:hypothetical protein